MIEIFVEKVSTDGSKVALRVANVRFVFAREPDGGVKLISRSKPEAQVRDPDACWVPKNLFNAAFRRACAILTR